MIDMEFRRVAYDERWWAGVVASYPEAEVFHTPAWLAYLQASQGVEPVVAEIFDGGRTVGHFVGGIVRRLGVRILGSPMPGWATQYMGFLLREGVGSRAAADALLRFAFGDLRCLHVELGGRSLVAAELGDAGWIPQSGATYLLDLNRSEEEILAGMSARTRTYVRRAARVGLVTEVVTGPEFADEYHAQLTEVFARQGLAPTYGVGRVRDLIRAVGPGDQLLLLRVRGPQGRSLATGVSVGRGALAVNWGTASVQSANSLHPNELLWWEMFRHWRARGATCFDLGGRGDYKAK
jgi:CelD/BcsL family acetyltransferase involved in cellulose biosynthesis